MNTLSLESFYHQAKAVVQQHGFAGIFPYIIVGFSLEAAPNMKPAVIVEIIVSNVRNNFIQVRSSTPDGALAELTKSLSDRSGSSLASKLLFNNPVKAEA